MVDYYSKSGIEKIKIIGYLFDFTKFKKEINSEFQLNIGLILLKKYYFIIKLKVIKDDMNSDYYLIKFI